MRSQGRAYNPPYMDVQTVKNNLTVDRAAMLDVSDARELRSLEFDHRTLNAALSYHVIQVILGAAPPEMDD